MKYIITFICLTLFPFSLSSQTLKKSSQPIVTNYREVIESIEYPISCRKNGIEGEVIIEIQVDAKGKIMDYDFIESVCPELRNAVEKVIPDLDFIPAINENNELIPCKINIPISFELTI